MSLYCPSAGPVTAGATTAAKPLLSLRTNTRLFYRFAPKGCKLVATCPNSFLLLPSIRRRRFYAVDTGDDEVPASEEEEEEEVEVGEDADEKPTTKVNVEEGRLYVGNLPYSITSSEISQIFGEAGNVVDVQIVYDKVTDRSRGFGFVTMGSSEEAKEAIRMFDNSQIGGRSVKVNFPEVPRGGERELMRTKIRDNSRSYVDSPHKIYAGNLSWSVTSQVLKDAFADQPGVLGAKVIYERNYGRSRGFGFISFESADDLQVALNAMNGVEVEGRALRLNLASERSPVPRSPETEGETEETSTENSELLSTVST